MRRLPAYAKERATRRNHRQAAMDCIQKQAHKVCWETCGPLSALLFTVVMVVLNAWHVREFVVHCCPLRIITSAAAVLDLSC